MSVSAARAAGLAVLSLAVSQGVAARDPSRSIVGSRTVAGATSTRPHCPYPEEAVYDGVGNPNAAASFSCQEVE